MRESEADHLGLLYMAKAGYDPRAARDLWVRIAQASQGSARPPEFLSTHPSEETRVQQIDAWAPRGAPLLHSAPLSPEAHVSAGPHPARTQGRF